MEHDVRDGGTIEEYRAAYKDSEDIFTKFSKTCGLSEAEYWALLMIREGFSTQSEICEQLSMSKQTLNSAFRLLVKKGLVRLEALEHNLRTKRIYLTEAGEQFVEQYIDMMLKIEERIWYRMTREERLTLIGLTRKYNTLIRAELQEYLKSKE